jgi:hypothetical protein
MGLGIALPPFAGKIASRPAAPRNQGILAQQITVCYDRWDRRDPSADAGLRWAVARESEFTQYSGGAEQPGWYHHASEPKTREP